MSNENVMSPDDATFEVPDIDDLLDTSNDDVSVKSEKVDPVSRIDAYNNVIDDDNLDNVNNEEFDGVQEYLMMMGVSDPRKINIENEDGEIEEVDFYSLSPEEQRNILTDLSTPNINQDEVNMINYLRRNGMTFQDAVNIAAKQQADTMVNQYMQKYYAEKKYEIDDYTDDELYVADLKSKYPNYSDEKLLSKLDQAKMEDDFGDEVNALREQYKMMEAQQIEQQRQQEYVAQEQYRQQLYNSLNTFNEIALDYTDNTSDTLEIEPEDKRRALSYILDVDAEGKTQLYRDMENPDTLIELAWLRTCGADALAGQNRYYKDIISQRNREIGRLKSQIEKLKNNSVVTTPRGAQTNSSSPWDDSGLL